MNTGNIGRSCVATNTRLHLIEPLGFKLNDKMVKRAGLDYWPHLDVTVYSDFKDFLEKNPGARPYMATTKTTQVYTDVHYDPDCYIMFGPESRGIPEELLIEDPERCGGASASPPVEIRWILSHTCVINVSDETGISGTKSHRH